MKLRLAEITRLSLVPTVSLSVGLVLLLAAASSPRPATAPGPDAVLGVQLRLMQALDAGDPAAIADCLPRADSPSAERIWLELVDAEGRPRTARGHAAASQLLAECGRQLATKRAYTRLTDSDSDCPSRVGWAVTELERTFGAQETETETDSRKRADDQDEGTKAQRLRSTLLVVHVEDGWKLLHWHLSSAEAAADSR